MAKKLTVKHQKNKYRALQYSTFVGEFVSILTPYIALGIANKDEWFTTEEGWKVGLGGALALALMGIAVLLITKKKENKELTGGYITLIIGWFAVTFVFLLLSSILEQITTIMFFGGLGLIGAFGLDMVSKNAKAKADVYANAMKDVRKKTIEEQIMEEMRTKGIKF